MHIDISRRQQTLLSSSAVGFELIGPRASTAHLSCTISITV